MQDFTETPPKQRSQFRILLESAGIHIWLWYGENTGGVAHLGITLNYESFRGEIYEMRPGYTGSSSTDVEFKKSFLSGGIYPLNFYLLNCMDISAGLKIARRLGEDVSGRINGTSISSIGSTTYRTPYLTDLNDGDDNLSSTWNFGLQVRIAYNVEMYDNLILSPEYSFYLGLTDEFNDILGGTKSMRHYFSLVLKVPLGK